MNWQKAFGWLALVHTAAPTTKHKKSTKKASKDSPRLFKELVDKGNKLEVQAREKLGEASNIGKTISIEERISKMRASLGFGHTASADDLERLEKKLDALSKKVDALSKASKAPAKAAPAKKAAAKKTAAKKAPAKKAAAKKAAE